MKNQEFKVGDKVVLNNILDDIWGRWVKENCNEGEVYTVSKVYSDGGLCSHIDMDGVFLTHKSRQFEIMPDVLTIVLRRPVDRKSVEKFLGERGYENKGTGFCNREDSRIIQVHLSGIMKGELTYNAQVFYDTNIKEAIEHTNSFLVERWDYKNIKVIKTKPSVNEAINQIKKYI